MSGFPRSRQPSRKTTWFSLLFPIICAITGILAAEMTIRQQPIETLPAPIIQPSPRCSIA